MTSSSVKSSNPSRLAAAVLALLAVAKPTNPRVADFDVSKILDNSFVQDAMQRKVGGE